jgi:hypothetical protein
MTIVITPHIEPDTAAALQSLQQQILAIPAPAPTPTPTPVDVITWPPIPTITFTQGVAGSISIPAPVSSLGLPLTVTLNAIPLPPGVTFDGAFHYDGVGAAGGTGGCILNASDGRTP